MMPVMIADTMHRFIQQQLAALEHESDIRVLYACESGSRAWGFASSDSDYDVRFIYVHRQDWYLSIEQRRDVIERILEHNLDVSGWDLRKALMLFRKSNPPMLEWLHSPIVYTQSLRIAQRLRALLPQYYSPLACMYHYLHMAEGNQRKYLQGETVWTKKYFYVLRPVLACRWIASGRGVVPMEFETLLETVQDDSRLMAEIQTLLERKRHGEELAEGPRNEVISDFVTREVTRLRQHLQGAAPKDLPLEPLNVLFRETVQRFEKERLRNASRD